MKKILFLLVMSLITLGACGGNSIEFKIVEKEYNDNGGRSIVRLVMDNPTEEEVEKVIKDLYTEEFFGSASIYANIHESREDTYGAMIAVARYARGYEGLPQVDVDEIDTVYIEWQ